MGRRVIRAMTDLDNRQGPRKWTMDHSKWRECTVYRIEWPDGMPAGPGLFASLDMAQRYAEARGWMLDIEHEEDCA